MRRCPRCRTTCCPLSHVENPLTDVSAEVFRRDMPICAMLRLGTNLEKFAEFTARAATATQSLTEALNALKRRD